MTDNPASGVFGQIAPVRMQQVVDTFGSILRSQGTITDVPDAASLYTNDFIDPSTRMG